MSKQKEPIHMRKAILIAYNCIISYEGTPIGFLEMEIDLIIPERGLNNPKDTKELNKWNKKYHQMRILVFIIYFLKEISYSLKGM